MTHIYTVLWQEETGWYVALMDDLNAEFDQSQTYGPYDTREDAVIAATPPEPSRTI